MRALWYLWFSSSVAMPFLMGFSEAAGTVAYAGSYGFVALGLLAGLWLASYPVFQSHCMAPGHRASLVLLTGLLFTLALWCFEIVRFFLLENMALPTWMILANAALAPMEKPAAFLNAMLCAISAPQPAQSQELSHNRGGGFVVVLLGFVAGVTRGWSWTLLLPSPAFPIPAASWNLVIDNRWADGLPLTVGVGIAFLLTLSWCHLACKLQEQSGTHAFSHVIGALCLGELTWRLASRVCPHILQITLLYAAVTLLAQIVCLAAAWTHVRRSHPTAPLNCNAQNGNPIVSRPPLSPHLKELFAKCRLTEQESAVMAASFHDLNSSQVAAELGISASTVRTYRARACDKLDVSNVDELIGKIGQFDDAPERGATTKSHASQTMHALSAMGAYTLAFLVFMPPAAAAACWESTWLIPFGGALGLVLYAVLQTVLEPHGRPHNKTAGRLSDLLVALMAVVAAATLQYCYGALAQSGPYDQQPTLLRMSTLASVAACMMIAAKYFFHSEGLAQPDVRGPFPALAGATALAALGSFSKPCWHIGATIASVLICLDAVSPHKDGNAKRALCAPASPTTLLCVASLAFVWEETLRGMSYASLQYCGSIFLAVSSCACILQLGKRLQHDIPAAAVFALGAIVLVYAKGLFSGLLMTTTVLGLLLSASNKTTRAQSPSWHTSPIIAAASSLCAGVYTANTWGSSISGSEGNLTFIAALSVLLSLVGALALTRTAARDRTTPLGGSASPHEQLVAALRLYELTPLQINVVVSVAEGHSIGQISQQLSYSRSRVHQILKEVYAALNLHNHAQLKAFLAQIRIDRKG